MLRIAQNRSSGGARNYYTPSVYYTESQELVGQWRGEGTNRLELSGQVDKDDWNQ